MGVGVVGAIPGDVGVGNLTTTVAVGVGSGAETGVSASSASVAGVMGAAWSSPQIIYREIHHKSICIFCNLIYLVGSHNRIARNPA